MIRNRGVRDENGFTFLEMLISILVMLPIMVAAVSLFSVGARQHAATQSGIDSNQEARVALEIMATEIAQAGSHPDVATFALGSITEAIFEQSIPVNSSAGFNVGDYVDVDVAPDNEIVRITGITANALRGVFRFNHNTKAPIRLYALPYVTGVIAPTVPANSTAVVPILRFFGHIQGHNSDPAEYDPTLQYVEYTHDSLNNQILRSATPVSQTLKNRPIPFLRNVRPGSVQFRVTKDVRGVVTAINVAFTARGSVKNGSQYQDVSFSSRLSIPSMLSASELLHEYQLYRGLYPPPPTPPIINAWSTNYSGLLQ